MVILFLNDVKKIENGEDGEIVVKTLGEFKVILVIKDNKVIDSISVDIKNSKVYSGVVSDNSPNWSDILIPVNLPYNTNVKTIDEIRMIEDSLVDDIMNIIVTYEVNETEII